jgi:DNA-binding transcriptional regulator YdaS (Cro superfamily)
MNPGMQKAVAIANGQSSLARQIGVERQQINMWIQAIRDVPLEHALTIEKITGVPLRELRPEAAEMLAEAGYARRNIPALLDRRMG